MEGELFACIIVFGISTAMHCIFLCRFYYGISDLHDRLEVVEQRQMFAQYTPAHVVYADSRVAIPIDDPV